MLGTATEVGHADFGDARCIQRLLPLVECFSDHPEVSIPQACETWAMTKAAYRFFTHPRVSPAAILAAHRATTVQRVAEHSRILAVQDPTTFNFPRHRQTPGVGPMGQAGLSGFFLHSWLAITSDGVQLGLLVDTTGVRPPESKDSHHPHKHRPLADKESRRGIDLMDEATAHLLAPTPGPPGRSSARPAALRPVCHPPPGC